MRKKMSFTTKKNLHAFLADDENTDVPFFKIALGQVAVKVKITLAGDERELLEFQAAAAGYHCVQLEYVR